MLLFSTLPPASRIPSPHTRRISPRFFHVSHTNFRIHLYPQYLSIISVHLLHHIFFLSTIPPSSIHIFVNHVCQPPSFPYLHNTTFDINHCETICANHLRQPQCFTYMFADRFVTQFCQTTNVKFFATIILHILSFRTMCDIHFVNPSMSTTIYHMNNTNCLNHLCQKPSQTIWFIFLRSTRAMCGTRSH